MDFSERSWSFLQRTFIQSQAGRHTPFINEDTEVQSGAVTGPRSHVLCVAELTQDLVSRSLAHAPHPSLSTGPDCYQAAQTLERMDWEMVFTVSSHDLPKSTGWSGPSPSRANSRHREVIRKGALGPGGGAADEYLIYNRSSSNSCGVELN